MALRLRGPAVQVDLTDVQRQPSGAASIALCATRMLESDTERRLREAEERVLMLEHDKRVLIDALRGTAS